MNGRPLYLLHVEDSPHDAALLQRAVAALPGEVRHQRVATAATLRDALAAYRPDLIVCDIEMPGFGGREAHAIACELAPGVPFLFLSGLGGEVADALARLPGVHGCLHKDRLHELLPAIERCLRPCEA